MNEVVLPLLLAAIIGLVSWLLARVTTIAQQVNDLWSWHKPDDQGRMPWKDQTPITDKLEQILHAYEKQTALQEAALKLQRRLGPCPMIDQQKPPE